MKETLMLGALLVAGSVWLVAPSLAHGGTYRGPGDTVPPGGANPGGALPPPGPVGPWDPPAPSPGDSPAPGVPGQVPGGGVPGMVLSPGGGDVGPDLSIWDFWWAFNREPYLNLRTKVRSMGPASATDDCFLGLGEERRAAGSLRPGEHLIRTTVVPALKEALATEEQNDIVTGCLIALAKIGDVKDEDGTSEFVEIIQRFLSAPEQEISETAALARGKGQKRPWAALALGVFGNAVRESGGLLEPGVTLALRDRAREGKSPVEYGAFALALGLVGDGASAGLLMERLEEVGTGSTDEMRGNLCVALGLMGVQEARAPLRVLVRASKFRSEVIKQAAVGLGLLGDKETVPLLLEMLQEAKGLSSQAAIATALGTIGDVNAVDGLVRMLAGETETRMTDVARGFAAVALGITCDKDELPWNTKISVNVNYRANVQTLTDPATGNGILDIL